MIRLERVTKRFPGGQVAVRELTIEFHTGQLTMLVGPSGCGKTTTLKMINRLIEPSEGRIFHDEQDVTHVDPVVLRLRMGYVIQNVGLFPHMSIADNVATVPRLLGWDKQRIRRRVNDLLELVGLDPNQFAHRYPHQLSGGQRQRVGVARALGPDPGLKRLSVTPIDLNALDRPPVVHADDSLADARRVLDSRWTRVVVLDRNDKPVGELDRDATAGDGRVGDRARPLEALIGADRTLYDAFSQMLIHQASWVAVVDGDRFRGVL